MLSESSCASHCITLQGSYIRRMSFISLSTASVVVHSVESATQLVTLGPRRHTPGNTGGRQRPGNPPGPSSYLSGRTFTRAFPDRVPSGSYCMPMVSFLSSYLVWCDHQRRSLSRHLAPHSPATCASLPSQHPTPPDPRAEEAGQHKNPTLQALSIKHGY
jgi:hypothetical protein